MGKTRRQQELRTLLGLEILLILRNPENPDSDNLLHLFLNESWEKVNLISQKSKSQHLPLKTILTP